MRNEPVKVIIDKGEKEVVPEGIIMRSLNFLFAEYRMRRKLWNNSN